MGYLFFYDKIDQIPSTDQIVSSDMPQKLDASSRQPCSKISTSPSQKNSSRFQSKSCNKRLNSENSETDEKSIKGQNSCQRKRIRSEGLEVVSDHESCSVDQLNEHAATNKFICKGC